MKVVILAAGIGSRLQPLTASKPKCMVKVAGKPILQHQINAFKQAGIEDVFIVTGYEDECVRKYCFQYKDINIKLIKNPDYKNTNNMYSLYLAKDYVCGEDFILVNGDVVFDCAIADSLIKHPNSDLVACDINTYSGESMKIIVNNQGYINAISKSITEKQAYATSIDLYKFSETSSKVFFDEIDCIIEQDKNLKDWTEVALDRLFRKQSLKMLPFDIDRKKWVEIDNYNDLAIADKVFSSLDRRLANKKLCFLDLDGTVYVGDKIIDGAKQFITYLKNKNIKYYFLSNNSSRSKSDYVKKLQNMGIETGIENIILSTDGVIEWLKKEDVRNLYVVGTSSMKEMFLKSGLPVDSNEPEYVVLGYDTELTYEKLKKAALFLQNGSNLLATHCDMVCPTLQGPIPDIGSILALFEAGFKIKPVKIFGKPNKEMVSYIMERHGIGVDETVVVGDRLYTDMELANRLGCDFICVLSGETGRYDIETSGNSPDLIVLNIGCIL